MSMVINTNVQATRTHGVYSRNTSAMNEAMTRVATAQKINSAKDGASVYAISERMRGQIRANDQANQNTQNDSALLKTAQGGISNTISILNTLRERAINSANDSNLNTNRSDIATEVQQLVQQIDDNANKVKFNGRTLLNGAVDNTVGRLNGANAVEANATVSDNPKATATHGVYNLTNLYTWDAANSKTTDATSTTTLVSLVKGNATGAGDTLFQKGDKITFSWKENGSLVTKSFDVTSANTLADLATAINGASGNLSVAWKTKDDDLTSSETNAAGDGTAAKAGKKNVVVDANTFDKLKASKDGIYAVGNSDKAITDFTVSVTYTGADGPVNRVESQEAIAFKGIQQAYGDKGGGSNAVFSTEWFNGETTGGISGSNSTAFSALGATGTTSTVWTNTLARVKFDVSTSKGDASITLEASSNIDELNKQLEQYGVQATLVKKGEAVTYNGSVVTTASGGNDAPLKAATDGLFFVGADGVDINSVKIEGLTATNTHQATVANTLSTAASTAAVSLVNIQNRASEPEAGGSAALTFFVGGEPNFGVDVTISKMTSKALLGTTPDGFASKFLTKEGAQSALTVIDNALNKALNEQTKLGAMEARLGYTSDNLTTMNENLEASDSVMRDADLAKEMTNYMKYSVLSQAAQYMLAQSGQNAFSVLNLLQQ